MRSEITCLQRCPLCGLSVLYAIVEEPDPGPVLLDIRSVGKSAHPEYFVVDRLPGGAMLARRLSHVQYAPKVTHMADHAWHCREGREWQYRRRCASGAAQ